MIFVPSKGRSQNAKLLQMAQELEFHDIHVVVEKEDIKEYKKVFPNFHYIQLPESNKGIAYVRNFIKALTEKAGEDSYWQLDDDITSLNIREGTKLVKSGFDVLERAQSALMHHGVALGGLEYGQFAWGAGDREFANNSYCDVAVWVNNRLTQGMRYNYYLEGKEDRDLAMQVIMAGLKTARTTYYAFTAPKNGSNAGGLKEVFYDVPDREKKCAERMVEVWGDYICQPVTKPDGRQDVKIYWERIREVNTQGMKQESLF